MNELWDEGRQARSRFTANLTLAAARWHGTPFAAHQRVCGAGVDCARLALSLLEEAGLKVDWAKLPPYHIAAGTATERPLILEFAKASGWFTLPPTEVPCPGDIAHFRVGAVSHHVGVMLGKTQFTHALATRSVGTGDLRDSMFGKRLNGFVRHADSPWVGFAPPGPRI